MYGPPKPARLPIELISAIAPAAAVPDSHAVGKVQNTAKVQNTPIAAIVSMIMVDGRIGDVAGDRERRCGQQQRSADMRDAFAGGVGVARPQDHRDGAEQDTVSR